MTGCVCTVPSPRPTPTPKTTSIPALALVDDGCISCSPGGVAGVLVPPADTSLATCDSHALVPPTDTVSALSSSMVPPYLHKSQPEYYHTTALCAEERLTQKENTIHRYRYRQTLLLLDCGVRRETRIPLLAYDYFYCCIVRKEGQAVVAPYS
jgi:hypothetical protein